MTETLRLELPFPPTVNTYWRHHGNRVLLSKKGREYKQRVHGLVMEQLGVRKPCTCDIQMSIELYPPDKRNRDIDNYSKAILDALEDAGVYENDSQVKVLLLVMNPPEPRTGRCVAMLEERNG